MGGSFPRAAMILTAVLMVTSSLLAGCIGDDQPEPVPTTQTASQVAPSQQPATLDVDLEHDFTQPNRHVMFEVEPNTTVSLRHVYFGPVSTGGAGTLPTDVCASGTEDARIVVEDPAGNVVYDASLKADSVTVGVAAPCGESIHQDTRPGVPIAAGTWTVSFTGTAFATGHLVLQS